MYIYEKRYKKIKFFKYTSNSFISWLCPLLKPNNFEENQYVYSEGEEVNSIFFLLKGRASFVLPSYDNIKYINIPEGGQFGVIDIVGSIHLAGEDIDDWIDNRACLQRQFTL